MGSKARTFCARLAAECPHLADSLTKRLGEDQANVFYSLASAPWPGHGWTYGSASKARSVLSSLEARGLAQRMPDGGYRPIPEAAAFRRAEQAAASAEFYASNSRAEAQMLATAEKEHRTRSAALRTLSGALDSALSAGLLYPTSAGVVAAQALLSELAADLEKQKPSR